MPEPSVLGLLVVSAGMLLFSQRRRANATLR
ncbi:MAG: PEP-CTERM sorting domain-containing protein [Limisphaerales bacterium]